MSIKSLFLACLLVSSFFSKAQTRLPQYPDSLFSTYYHQRVSLFQALPQTKDDIIFLGNSITDGGEWSELFGDMNIKNRGISGDVTAGIINRLEEIAEGKPAKVFLMIGTNDLARNISADSVTENILHIAKYLKQSSPSTQLYVQSILPVNPVFGKFGGHTRNSEAIEKVNHFLAGMAQQHGYQFVDLQPVFSNKEGLLDTALTNDGLHLNGTAYLRWQQVIFPLVYNLNTKPSLLPLPQKLSWNDQQFPLYQIDQIHVSENGLNNEATLLQSILSELGRKVSVTKQAPTGKPYLALRLRTLDKQIPSQDAYHLTVNADSMVISAANSNGIFHGIQTLRQLMRTKTMVPGCEITDWPAFSWRGYMVDVGRNYQSLTLLKQQIDIMAQYKLNIFHFHLTEDIAWRLQMKKYPQLTAPENMIRSKGKFYSISEMKELIEYCRERYITLVPEIDMPGHSAAFTRAMKTDMQSDSGLQIVKNILKEFCETYDVPYLHIGADEVKITNKNFVPEVTAYIESFGKKVIGWQPGGNFSKSTIRQLWMDDNGKIAGDTGIRYIDSRHLYLNHFDPLELVPSLFFRQIGNRNKEDAEMMGATLCLWPDRRVEREEDALQMNGVYPGMLSFAERTWRGGGQKGWLAKIGEPDKPLSNSFQEFENRLMDHKKQFFTQLSFPYAQQSKLVWDLHGPFNNGGNLDASFAPELNDPDSKPALLAKRAVGGTIVLRHWWAPLIKGELDNPTDSSTWYASTKIWSDEDGYKGFWIGFNNISRSTATDSPLPRTWNNLGGKIWVNDTLIAPPTWARAGQKGHPEIPLVDEGYEYREPTKILLKKGWNKVLIKAPVGSFKGRDWQHPVKWMFSFVPAP